MSEIIKEIKLVLDGKEIFLTLEQVIQLRDEFDRLVTKYNPYHYTVGRDGQIIYERHATWGKDQLNPPTAGTSWAGNPNARPI